MITTALGAGNIDSAAGPLAQGGFNTGAAANEADDRIIYDSASGAPLFEADGNDAGVAVQFAALSPGIRAHRRGLHRDLRRAGSCRGGVDAGPTSDDFQSERAGHYSSLRQDGG